MGKKSDLAERRLKELWPKRNYSLCGKGNGKEVILAVEGSIEEAAIKDLCKAAGIAKCKVRTLISFKG